MKELVNVSYYEYGKIRKELLEKNSDDYVFFQTNSSILISVPHGVSQIRLGMYKRAEIGTIPLGILLSENTNANLLIKTKNNDDDANFYENSSYRKKLQSIVKTQNIKYIIDLHGMKKSRESDINLGINFGQNIKKDTKLFDSLVSALNTQGFFVQIDNPFCAGPKTIAGHFSKEFNIWTIQIEINCGITNDFIQNKKCNLLINILIDWINRNY